jgi:metal-responsive CopG/Arc/MetJ family transcriptional regulator
MARIAFSLPDDLLSALDAEAERRQLSRSSMLKMALCRELDLPRRERDAILCELNEIAAAWDCPLNAESLASIERRR